MKFKKTVLSFVTKIQHFMKNMFSKSRVTCFINKVSQLATTTTMWLQNFQETKSRYLHAYITQKSFSQAIVKRYINKNDHRSSACP